MSYSVIYHKEAIKTLDKMDPNVREMIVNWIDKNLKGCENPRIRGKSLKHDKKGIWRYRVGDYRILAQIRNNELLVLVLDVGKRDTIYDR